VEKSVLSCDHVDMEVFVPFVGSMAPYREAIGFWAGILTTVAFAPQVIRTWRTGGDQLSWTMLALFGVGVGLWFLYGLLRMSGPLMLANGLTGFQVLVLIGLKVWRPNKAPRTRSG
jgi:MtN3 and saliva related transmembrane protein